jgi:dephospho-CoA kinase
VLRIGLTGGIASGKSIVGEMFVQLGAQLIQSDAIAHALMEPGRPIYNEVVRCFGPSVLSPDGTINRAKLAELAFGASGADSSGRAEARVKELNAIVHPAVIAHENRWMDEIGARDSNAIAIVEAALILEAGAADRFDHLIVVTCTPDQRVERFARRQGMSEEAARAEVARRMAAQIPDQEKVRAADFVIDNSGSLEHTEAQVRAVFSQLRSSL